MRITLKTRVWLNAALVVIALILAAIIYFKPGEKPPAPPVPLTQLQSPEITSIKIAQPGNATVELARVNGTWQMTAPAKMRADQFQVKALLDSLHADVKSSFAAQAPDLAKYGLAPPRLQLWLNGTEFDLGATEPVDNYRYVLSGGQVHLINGILFYRASHRPYWWASKRLLPEGSTITAIQLPNATLTLKDAKWQLAPAEPTVSTDAIQTLVENWQDAEAIGTEKLGSGKPQGEVAIQLSGNATPIRFAILQDPSFFVLARPDLGIEYQFASDQREQLLEFKNPSPAPGATTAKAAATRTPPPHASSQPQAKAGL